MPSTPQRRSGASNAADIDLTTSTSPAQNTGSQTAGTGHGARARLPAPNHKGGRKPSSARESFTCKEIEITRADGQKEPGFRWTCNHCEDVVVGDASRRQRPVIWCASGSASPPRHRTAVGCVAVHVSCFSLKRGACLAPASSGLSWREWRPPQRPVTRGAFKTFSTRFPENRGMFKTCLKRF